jgi:hypothetical protein
MATTESEIIALARRHPVLKRFYKCCFGVGEYPAIFQPNSVYFLNTATREKSDKVGHWVVIYSSFNKFIVYVDSAGLPPRNQLAKKLAKEKVYVYNKDILQHPAADSCGKWCLLIGVLLARGKSLTDIKANFTQDLLRNEKVMLQMYAREFSDVSIQDGTRNQTNLHRQKRNGKNGILSKTIAL